MSEPSPTSRRRLEGTLVTKAALSEAPKGLLRGNLISKTSPAIGRVATGEMAGEYDVPTQLPGLEGKAESGTLVLDGKATLVIGADVTGPWHYSRGRIDKFTADKAERTGGKFGKGTYLGVGELKGETVDGP